jgi:hypothetical protein
MPIGSFGDVSSLAGVAALFIAYINVLIGLLVTLATVLFLYSGVKLVYKPGGSNQKEKDALRWGLVALFIIVSIWGIMRLMCKTFTGSNYCNNVTSLQRDSHPDCYVLNGQRVCP